MFEGWKIRQKLSSDVVQKFEQVNTISLQFGNEFICQYNFTFFLGKNRLKKRRKDRPPDLIGKLQH